MNVRAVVKVGGGLLSRAGAFDLVTSALTAFAKGRRVLVVPGGGPFAAAVQELIRRIKIGPDAAYWMALLGMDQYAHALTARTAGAVLVEQPPEIEAALDAGHLPVLAPSRWVRSVDPFPHSWDVSSDSIAAWVAGQVSARRLVLIKAARGDGAEVTDSHNLRALPPGVDSVVLTPHALEKLGDTLDQAPATAERRTATEKGR